MAFSMSHMTLPVESTLRPVEVLLATNVSGSQTVCAGLCNMCTFKVIKAKALRTFAAFEYSRRGMAEDYY
jgi:hypothetical protein